MIPTYRRDQPLEQTLQRLTAQSLLPVHVAVVDNAAAEGCRRLCESLAPGLPYELTYIESPENEGPAGGTTRGMLALLGMDPTITWIARADDESPPRSPHHFEVLLEALEGWPAEQSVGGIGTHGARYDRRTGTLRKPAKHPGRCAPVDYLATNYMPLFAADAIRQVGGMRTDLFFGHTEVEFGLRLRRAGYELLRWQHVGVGQTPSSSRAQLGEVDWRRYYSMRNQVVIAREYGEPWSVVRASIVPIVKALLGLPRQPRKAIIHLRLACRAVSDAWRGRLGRTIEPTVVGGELDRRL